MFKQSEHVFFAFMDGKTVQDSQNRPRMYKSREQYEKCYPAFRLQQADLVEYAPVGWISVKERLPDAGERVIAKSRSGFVGEGYIAAKGKWFRHYGEPFLGGEVVEWIPMPYDNPLPLPLGEEDAK